MPQYTPMLTNFPKSKRKSTLLKQLDLPIVFKYTDEKDLFESLISWGGHQGFVVIEHSDHYVGLAKPLALGSGAALLASWDNGTASLYVYSTDRYDHLVKGENKSYVALADMAKKRGLFGSLFEFLRISV
jgi:hypothetical protein